jgi:hypothetical protein
VVVFTNRDAAATACGTRVDFPRDRFAEDRELARSAAANELVVDPFSVMPMFLLCLYYSIH